MKFTILLSSAILFATAISAYADDSNLMCRRNNSCDTRNGNGNFSISGLDFNVKSSDRGNRNIDNHDNISNDDVNNSDIVDDHSDIDDTDTNDVANNDNSVDTGGTNNNDVVNNDTDSDNQNNNPTDVVDNSNNNNAPSNQSNSNDIEGYDPFGGLYGPGT